MFPSLLISTLILHTPGLLFLIPKLTQRQTELMHRDLLVSCLPHPIHLLLQRSELVGPLLKMACLLEDQVQTCWGNKQGASQLTLLSPQPHLLKYSLKFFLLTPQVLGSILKENILFTKVTFACLLPLPRRFTWPSLPGRFLLLQQFSALVPPSCDVVHEISPYIYVPLALDITTY